MTVKKNKVAIYVEVEPRIGKLLEDLVKASGDMKLSKAQVVTMALENLKSVSKVKK